MLSPTQPSVCLYCLLHSRPLQLSMCSLFDRHAAAVMCHWQCTLPGKDESVFGSRRPVLEDNHVASLFRLRFCCCWSVSQQDFPICFYTRAYHTTCEFLHMLESGQDCEEAYCVQCQIFLFTVLRCGYWIQLCTHTPVDNVVYCLGCCSCLGYLSAAMFSCTVVSNVNSLS